MPLAGGIIFQKMTAGEKIKGEEKKGQKREKGKGRKKRERGKKKGRRGRERAPRTHPKWLGPSGLGDVSALRASEMYRPFWPLESWGKKWVPVEGGGIH